MLFLFIWLLAFLSVTFISVCFLSTQRHDLTALTTNSKVFLAGSSFFIAAVLTPVFMDAMTGCDPL